jgi:sigma-E factor negative regulatory protein RseA
MGRGELSKQQISAFADGELPKHEVPVVMASLRAAEHASDWDIYHQIGDVLRSESMAAPVSARFTESLAARLAAAPHRITKDTSRGECGCNHSTHRCRQQLRVNPFSQ